MVNWQLSKGVSAEQCHMTVSQAIEHNMDVHYQVKHRLYALDT